MYCYNSKIFWYEINQYVNLQFGQKVDLKINFHMENVLDIQFEMERVISTIQESNNHVVFLKYFKISSCVINIFCCLQIGLNYVFKTFVWYPYRTRAIQDFLVPHFNRVTLYRSWKCWSFAAWSNGGCMTSNFAWQLCGSIWITYKSIGIFGHLEAWNF